MLQIVADMFFIDGSRDLSSGAEEVEICTVSASATGRLSGSAKGIVVQIIAGFLELVTETVIGILKVEAMREEISWGIYLKKQKGAYISSSPSP